jgi:hypothetical protein
MFLERAGVRVLVFALAVLACSESADDGGSNENTGGAAGSAGGSGTSGSAGSGGVAGSSAVGGTGGTAGAGDAGAAGSGGTTGGAGSGGVPAFCGGLTVSGIVEFEIGDETLTVGTMNGAFFAEARRLFESGEQRIPVFNTLVDGSACDAQWSWHPDPTDLEFADITIELCDGLPSYVEENKAEWFQSVGNYCPWSARVTDFIIVDPL